MSPEAERISYGKKLGRFGQAFFVSFLAGWLMAVPLEQLRVIRFNIQATLGSSEAKKRH